MLPQCGTYFYQQMRTQINRFVKKVRNSSLLTFRFVLTSIEFCKVLEEFNITLEDATKAQIMEIFDINNNEVFDFGEFFVLGLFLKSFEYPIALPLPTYRLINVYKYIISTVSWIYRLVIYAKSCKMTCWRKKQPVTLTTWLRSGKITSPRWIA